MSDRRGVRNVAASVLSKLADVARRDGRDFNAVLKQYFQERLLSRLARSGHRNQFALKGALLFVALDFDSEEHQARSRPTKDIDLEAMRLISDPPELVRVFSAIASVASDVDDGVVFEALAVEAERIQDDEHYEGVRLHIPATLGNARDRLQIDVAFGNAITPGPMESEYPTLLGFPRPTLLTYPLETVCAEKLEAAVALGEVNSRLKDFRDLYVISGTTAFEGENLQRAFAQTFERRDTEMRADAAIFTDRFAEDEARQRAWDAYRRKQIDDDLPHTLAATIRSIIEFVKPAYDAARTQERFRQRWDPTARTWRESGQTSAR